MLIGDSKSGKTTALASLVEAGYNLGIVDMDCKIHPSFLEHRLLAKDPALLERVQYVSYRDKYVSQPATAIDARDKGKPLIGQPLIPKSGTAYVKATQCLDKWPEDDSVPSKWGPDYVFVVDTLNLLSKAAYNQAYSMQPEVRDGRILYNMAQRAIESYMAVLFGSAFKTNVLVLSHITDIALEGAYDKEGNWKPLPNSPVKGFPTTIGQALSKTIAGFSNELWSIEIRGQGTNAQRVINIHSTPRMDLGTSAFGIEGHIDAENGLAKLFKRLSGRVPG